MADELAAVFLVGRILFAFFFVAVAGVGHIKRAGMMVGYAESSKLPMPVLAGYPAGVWLIAGGLSVALGAWGDVGALMLGVFVIPAAGFFHRFWKIEDPMQKQTQMQFFFRNVTFLGAALMVFAFFSAAGDGLRFTLTDPLFTIGR